MSTTSTITKCQYTGEWKAPDTGDIIHFHDLTMKNGDFGNVGVKEKYDQKIAVGTEIEYTQKGKRFKLETNNSTSQGSYTKPTYKKTYKKGPDQFLGYACGYAKDLVIAGKATAKDLKQFENAANKIYAHFQKLLDDNDQNPD